MAVGTVGSPNPANEMERYARMQELRAQEQQKQAAAAAKAKANAASKPPLTGHPTTRGGGPATASGGGVPSAQATQHVLVPQEPPALLKKKQDVPKPSPQSFPLLQAPDAKAGPAPSGPKPGDKNFIGPVAAPPAPVSSSRVSRAPGAEVPVASASAGSIEVARGVHMDRTSGEVTVVKRDAAGWTAPPPPPPKANPAGSATTAAAPTSPLPAGTEATKPPASNAEIVLDATQLVLDVSGIVDPTPVSDGANAVISLFRGDFKGAAISAAGILPAGDLLKAGRIGERMGSLVDKAADNPAARAALRPVLEKLGGLLDSAAVDRLPGPVRDMLRSADQEIDSMLRQPEAPVVPAVATPTPAIPPSVPAATMGTGPVTPTRTSSMAQAPTPRNDAGPAVPTRRPPPEGARTESPAAGTAARGHVSEGVRKAAARGAIEEGVSGAVEGTVTAAVDSETWQDGAGEGAKRVFLGGVHGAGAGAVGGGAGGGGAVKLNKVLDARRGGAEVGGDARPDPFAAGGHGRAEGAHGNSGVTEAASAQDSPGSELAQVIPLRRSEQDATVPQATQEVPLADVVSLPARRIGRRADTDDSADEGQLASVTQLRTADAHPDDVIPAKESYVLPQAVGDEGDPIPAGNRPRRGNGSGAPTASQRLPEHRPTGAAEAGGGANSTTSAAAPRSGTAGADMPRTQEASAGSAAQNVQKTKLDPNGDHASNSADPNGAASDPAPDPTVWVRTPHGTFVEYRQEEIDGNPVLGRQIDVHGSDGPNFVVGFGEDFPQSSDPLVETARVDAVRYSKPKVSDRDLQNRIDSLYHGAEMANPIGNGSTADVIRWEEWRTGLPVGGTFHGDDKGPQMIRSLEKWLDDHPDAPESDRRVAEWVLDDLRDAVELWQRKFP